MSPGTRVFVVAGAAAALAAGGTVALAVVSGGHEGAAEEASKPLAGAPPLALDLGVRVDPEARALRRAEGLYAQKRRVAAGRIFDRYQSPEARIGAAFSAWPNMSLAKLERLALERRRDSLVLLHLGFANFWAGHSAEATTAWREAAEAQPDSATVPARRLPELPEHVGKLLRRDAWTSVGHAHVHVTAAPLA